jgi:hypothetical protein
VRRRTAATFRAFLGLLLVIGSPATSLASAQTPSVDELPVRVDPEPPCLGGPGGGVDVICLVEEITRDTPVPQAQRTLQNAFASNTRGSVVAVLVALDSKPVVDAALARIYGSPTERSANGRNGRVYIKVEGSGRDVTHWETLVHSFHGDGCVRPSAYFNIRDAFGTYQDYAAHWGPGCLQAPPQGYYLWSASNNRMPARYMNDVDACNAWVPSVLSGYPCVRIRL